MSIFAGGCAQANARLKVPNLRCPHGAGPQPLCPAARETQSKPPCSLLPVRRCLALPHATATGNQRPSRLIPVVQGRCRLQHRHADMLTVPIAPAVADPTTKNTSEPAIACPPIRLTCVVGMRCFVTGEVGTCRRWRSMASRSYVTPSAATTGSRKICMRVVGEVRVTGPAWGWSSSDTAHTRREHP